MQQTAHCAFVGGVSDLNTRVDNDDRDDDDDKYDRDNDDGTCNGALPVLANMVQLGPVLADVEEATLAVGESAVIRSKLYFGRAMDS